MPKSPKGPKARKGGKILPQTRTGPDKWNPKRTKDKVSEAWEDAFIELMKGLQDEKEFSWSNRNDEIKTDFESILGMFQYRFQIVIFIKKH